MNICLLNGGFDTWLTSTEQLLERYCHVPSLAEALANCGHTVTAIQAFHRSESQRFGNAAIEFVEIPYNQGSDWAEVDRIEYIAGHLESCRPDVVHVFGLTLISVCRAVGRWCSSHGVAVTASFHGGQPGRNSWLWWRQRRALAGFSAFFFSNSTTADQWQQAGLIPKRAEIVLVPEVSSHFTRQPKRAARDALMVDGDPLFVWAG